MHKSASGVGFDRAREFDAAVLHQLEARAHIAPVHCWVEVRHRVHTCGVRIGLGGVSRGSEELHLTTFSGLLPANQMQHLALTVLHVPCSLDRGRASPRTLRV